MIADFFRTRLHRLQRTFKNFSVYRMQHDLTRLGLHFETDKTNGHFYTPHYMTHLSRFRSKRFNLLEIGVGGYDNPQFGGHSLRMWKHYFPKANIFSLDIHDKSALQEERIRIFQGSQVDPVFLDKVVAQVGDLDVIIDDGSHINEHVIFTFKHLFPKLRDGGIYVVEDMQTSYWPEFGGSSEDLQKPGTMMNFFKQLTDSLNYEEFVRPGYEPSYYDRKIVAMHFYHNMLFIEKGDNREGSNYVVENRFKD